MSANDILFGSASNEVVLHTLSWLTAFCLSMRDIRDLTKVLTSDSRTWQPGICSQERALARPLTVRHEPARLPAF